MRGALESRSLIEQAKGMLAERLQVTADEAFDQIRGFARASRRPVRDVCQDAINGANSTWTLDA